MKLHVGTNMRLLLNWDPEIDGDFQRRFERALGELAIEHDRIDAIDEPRPGAVMLAVASPASAPRDRPKDAILIIGGPGDTAGTSALRLETRDIDETSRRWLGVIDKLAAALDRRALVSFVAAGDDTDARKAWALAHPADPLAADVKAQFDPVELRARLAAEAQRAHAAESRLREHERRLAEALREKSGAEDSAIGARHSAEAEATQLRADLDAANQRITELDATLESTAFALGFVPMDRREAVAVARREAGIARSTAERAETLALDAPDSLMWAGARFRGETRNGLPHGLGVMTYLDGTTSVGSYAGQFEGGFAAGYGVGDHLGFRWRGTWQGDCPAGPGVLDHAGDGHRYEGEVVPIDGAPRRVRGRGHLWHQQSALLKHSASPVARPMLPAPR